MLYLQRKRNGIAALLIVALLVAAFAPVWGVPSANAQASFCPSGLTAEDCEILKVSTEELKNLRSFNVEQFNFSLNFGTGEDALSLAVDGSGPVVLGDNPAADFSFNLLTVNLDNQTETLNGAFRVVDRVAYLGVEEEAGLDWKAVRLGDTDFDADDLDMFGQGLENLPNVDTSDLQFVTWTRDNNITVDGEELAVFYIDIGLAEFVTSPFVVELVTELALSQAGDYELSPATLSIIVSALLQELSNQLSEQSTFRVTEYISLSSHYIHYLALDLSFNLDLGFITGFSPELDELLPGGALSFDLDFTVAMNQHNADFTIVAPENYEDVTDELGELLEDLGQGGMDFAPNFGEPTSSSSTGNSLSVSDAVSELSAGSETVGTLTGDDVVVYWVQASAGTELQIAARALSDGLSLDTQLDLYDANGNLLASNDDQDDAPAALGLGLLDSYIAYEVPEDGVYLIAVSPVFSVDSEKYVVILNVE